MRRKAEISINHWLRVFVSLKEQTDEYTLDNLLKTQGKILVGLNANEFIDEAEFCLNYFAEYGYIIFRDKKGATFTYWGIQKSNITFEFTKKFDELLQELKKKKDPIPEGSVASVVHNYYGEYTAGDKVTASSTGNNSPVITKSENATVTYNLIGQLKGEIEQKYKGDDKEEILEALAEVKRLSSNPKNKNRISSKLGWILTKTSELATVVSLIAQLLSATSIAQPR